MANNRDIPMENIERTLLEFRQRRIVFWLHEETGELSLKAPKGALSGEDKDWLKEHKRSIVSILKKRNATAVSDKSDFRLTDIQSAYLLGRNDLFDYGGVACHTYIEYKYPRLDRRKTEAIWNTLIKRHDMMHTIIYKTGSQSVLREVPNYQIVENDFRGLAEDEVLERMDNIREEKGHKVYDTEHWPLFDICLTQLDDETVMHFSIEFLIADWASILILFQEFDALYLQPEKQLPQLEYSFFQYLQEEEKQFDTPDYFRDRDYWLERIDTLPSAPTLPVLKQGGNKNEPRFQRRSLHLDKETWNRFKELALGYKITPTAVVLAVYALVLERWSRNKSFCLNLTLLNRQPFHEQIEQIVGDFTSVSLLEVDMTKTRKLYEYAQMLQAQLFDDLDHKLFSGVRVLREMGRKRGKEASLMPIVFTSAIGVMDAKTDQSADGRSPLGRLGDFGISQTPQVFIDCQAADNENGLDVNWDVREDVFPDGLMEEMFGQFYQILLLLGKADEEWEAEECVKLPEYQLALFQQANDTAGEMGNTTLHGAIWEQIARVPDKTALIQGDRELTYAELGQRAAGLAEKLKSSGGRPGDRMAICIEKAPEQVIAVLAILSIGGIYVPFDLDQPKKRMEHMLEQANIKQIVCSSEAAVIEAEGVIPVCIGTDISAAEPFTPYIGSPGEAAYVIYTSGSTGMPKGIEISHSGAMNTVEDVNRRFGITENDSILGLSRLNFDLSVYDIFGMLSIGGTLVYPGAEKQIDPSHWYDVIVSRKITTWNTVPALMKMLLSYANENTAGDLSSMKTVLLSGDWIPLDMPGTIKKQMEHAAVISLGGATEASIWSNYHVCNADSVSGESIPYGYPLKNQGFRIMDSRMRDCPVGVAGDLYIYGEGLGLRYVGDPDLTAERFVILPKERFLHQDGLRLYKTGDLGKYLANGEIQFLGREDNQVKIKGHRIELGEIEAALKKYPGIADACVVTTKDKHGEDIILAAGELEHEKADKNITDIKALEQDVAAAAEQIGVGLMPEDVKANMEYRDKAILTSMLYAMQQLQLFQADKWYSEEQLLLQSEIIKKHYWLVKRWLFHLTKNEFLIQDGQQRYQANRVITGAERDEIWNKAKMYWNEKFGGAVFMEYLRNSGYQLDALLKGELDPVTLLYPEGRVDYVQSFYSDNLSSRYTNKCFAEVVKRITDQKPGETIKILEIGAGTGATSIEVLPLLQDKNYEYFYTDVSNFFLPVAKKRFAEYKNMNYGVLDIDSDYRAQGFSSNSYDIIIAAGVLENARDIPYSLSKIKELVVPGGWLVFTDPTEEQLWVLGSQGFMMMPPSDELRKTAIYIDDDMWEQLLSEGENDKCLVLPGEASLFKQFGISFFTKQMKQKYAGVRMPEVKEFLRSYVPNYMIPSHIEIVDSIPLTANGKLDRAQVSTWLPEKNLIESADKSGGEEKSDLEMKLEEVISEVLGVSNIGDEDNFYDLGADSLIMARAAGQLRDMFKEHDQEIGYDVLLKQLLNYPTLKELNENINKYLNKADDTRQSTKKGSNAVLTYYDQDSVGPVRVIFHAGLGTMNCFRFLIAELKKQTLGPILGITVKDPDVYAAIAPEELIERAADDYAKCLMEENITSVQLIGYCSGGLLAIEAGRRLLEHNIEIVDLTLIDTLPVKTVFWDALMMETVFLPNLNITIDQVFPEVAYQEIEAAFRYIIGLYEGNIPQDAHMALEHKEEYKKVFALLTKMKQMNISERFRLYAQVIKERTGADTPAEMAESLFKTYKQSLQGSYFTPAPYLGDVRYLIANEQTAATMTPPGGAWAVEYWENICIGGFTTVIIDGNHLTCVEDPDNAGKTAEILALGLK